ncbi:hypothetical protein D9613_012341 [Agrocybe pediades]|uniref:TPR-like protein n=1 Tax=Agrocybe pediades TaxID=84607 RepID=A0A8H4QEM5_9AGAR|nr:hypothetical protein D9613_012341 [Agrocybe pediades]
MFTRHHSSSNHHDHERLNTDILYSIFNLNASDYHCDTKERLGITIRTSQVCKAWRGLLLESATIWAKLVYIGPSARGISLKRASEALTRSKTAPLWLEGNFTSTKDIGQEDLFDFFIKILRKDWERMQNITLVSAPHMCFVLHDILSAYSNPLHRTAPTLRSFNINCTCWCQRQPEPLDMPPSSLFSNVAPFIREFRARSKVLTFSIYAPWLAGLRVFSTEKGSTTSTLRELVEALRSMPLLEEMEIGHEIVHDPRNDAKENCMLPIHLPLLTYMYLDVQAIHWLFLRRHITGSSSKCVTKFNVELRIDEVEEATLPGLVDELVKTFEDALAMHKRITNNLNSFPFRWLRCEIGHGRNVSYQLFDQCPTSDHWSTHKGFKLSFVWWPGPLISTAVQRTVSQTLRSSPHLQDVITLSLGVCEFSPAWALAEIATLPSVKTLHTDHESLIILSGVLLSLALHHTHLNLFSNLEIVQTYPYRRGTQDSHYHYHVCDFLWKLHELERVSCTIKAIELHGDCTSQLSHVIGRFECSDRFIGLVIHWTEKGEEKSYVCRGDGKAGSHRLVLQATVSRGLSVGNAVALSGLLGMAITNPAGSAQGLVSFLESTPNDTMNLSYLSAGIKVLAVIGEKSGFSWVSGPAGIALEIVRIVESAQANKEACRAVAIRVFRTLHAIHQRASPNIEQSVRELQRELRKVLDTVRVLSAKNKFSQALQADDIKKQTMECDKALDQCIALFSVKAHVANAADFVVVKSGIDEVKTMVQSLKIEEKTVGVSLANLNISSTAPPPPTIFVGRDDLLTEGTDHLITAPGARLAILGQGGIGKTSLSLAILHHTRVKNAFADKRYFVSCESLKNGLDLAQAILQTLDVSILSQKLDLKTALVQQLESLGKSLFLFDNFETLSNDSSSLTILETISSISSISLFINMRGEFPPPSISWSLLLPARGLGPLSLTAAKALYLQRQSTSPDTNVPNTQLDSLLTEVDCVPLAVFILSELGKRYPIEVLQQRWMQSKTRLLKLPGAASSRLTSVAISLDMSMNSTMLKDHPEAVRLLHLLAFLPEGLPNWSILFPLITSSFEDSYDALDTLCQTSLVQRSDHVISMLNPTRQYLNSSMDTHRKAVEFDLDIVFKFILDSVRENLDTLVLLGKANIADLFSLYLDSYAQTEHVQEGLLCADYLYDHDMLTTALIDSVIIKAKALGSSEILAKAFRHKGKILFSLSDWKDSVEAYCAACALYQQLGYKSEMAQCLISLGNSYVTQDDHVRSAERYSEAYTIYTELEDQSGAASSLIQLGESYRMQNKYAEAAETHVNASTIFKEIGNQKGLADSLKAHADDLYSQHEYSEAYSILQEAVRIYTQIEDQFGLANAMASMGNVLKMQSKLEEAIEKYQHACDYFKRMNKFLVEATCLRSIGDILGLQGKYAQALEQYDVAYKIFAQAKYQSGMALCLDSKGYALIVVNKYGEAMEALQTARRIFSSIGGKLDLANSLNNIGDCYKMQEQYAKALETYDDAYKLHELIHNKVGMAKSLKSLGDVLRLQRKFSEAFTKIKASLDMYTEVGDQRGRAGSLLLLGNDLLRRNDRKSAIENFLLASSIYQALGNVHGMADSFNFLGDAYRMSNNPQESLKMYTDAHALYQQLGHRQGEANSLKSLGDILRVQQKYNEALKSHKEALGIYTSLGENLGTANCLKTLADDLILLTKYPEAKEKLESAYEIFRKLEEPLGMANSKISLGEIFNKQGDVGEASKCFEEALAISEKIQYRQGMASASYSLGHNFSKDGNYDQAIQKYNAAYEGFEEISNKAGMTTTLKALRDVLRLQGEHGQAEEKEKAAYLIYKELFEGLGMGIVDSAGNDLIRQNLLA